MRLAIPPPPNKRLQPTAAGAIMKPSAAEAQTLARQTMGILTRLFRGVHEPEHGGIRLEEPNPWEVSPTNEVERFLRALPLLVTDGSIAYFEGTGEPHVAEYLRKASIPAPVQVAIGTIWPRPDRYHVPLTTNDDGGLAAFLR